MSMNLDASKRDSGVELLRIIAMFLIVLSHVTQTANSIIPIDIGIATHQMTHFVLSFFRMLGALGNMIFFIISAWFLLDSKEVKIQKIQFILVTVWIVSIVYLTAFLVFYKGHISPSYIIKSLFPNFFANNWFLTCYMLFYPIHTLLNTLIKASSQQKLLKMCVSLFILYVLCNTIRAKTFFPSLLILWVTLYLIIGYMKFYLHNLSNNKIFNFYFLCGSIAGILTFTYLTNLLGLHFGVLRDKVLYWGTNYSVFWVLSAITLLNLFRTIQLRSELINKLASYMLLVYLVHENLLLRKYIRPNLFSAWHVYLGGENPIIDVISFALALFILALIVSMIFNKLFHPFINGIAKKMNDFIERFYIQLTQIILKFE